MTSGLWYRAALRDDRTVDEQVSMIREQFAAAVEAAGWPDGACLFLVSRHTGDATVRALFFSPAAISVVPHLIAVCGADPSPPPDRACATLLVGKPTDWDLLPRQTH
jgi:hypothetical protein